MKKMILFWLVLVFTSSISGQTIKFYEKIINDSDCWNCYFIPLDIDSESFSGKVVVESDKLFNYIKATKQIDEKASKSFVLSLLQEKRKLILESIIVNESGSFLVGNYIPKYSFRVVKKSQTVDSILEKGCKTFIEYYFGASLVETKEGGKSSCKELIKKNSNDLLMKPRFNLNEQNNVISKLFEMEIPTHIDDISGSLRIGYLALD